MRNKKNIVIICFLIGFILASPINRNSARTGWKECFEEEDSFNEWSFQGNEQLKSITTTIIKPEWNTTFGGADLIQTTDGGFVITGSRDWQMWLLKTNTTGQAEWNRTLGGSDGLSLVQTTDGGFAIVGYTYSDESKSDIRLVKTDATGQAEWNNTFGGPADDAAWSVVQTADEGFVIGGFTGSYGAGSSDMWLVKTNATGQHIWNQTFGGSGGECAYSMIQTTDGGYALAGFTNPYFPGSQDWNDTDDDFWLVKTNATGQAEWNQTFGGTGRERAHSLVQTTDGGYALAGVTGSYGAGDGDFWLVKTDATGQAQWNQTFGGSAGESAFSLVQTTDGGFALAGYAFGLGTWLVKTNATGQTEWNYTFTLIDEDGMEGFGSLVQTADDDEGYVVLTPGNMWRVKIIPEELTTTSTTNPTTTTSTDDGETPSFGLGVLILALSVSVVYTRKRRY